MWFSGVFFWCGSLVWFSGSLGWFSGSLVWFHAGMTHGSGTLCVIRPLLMPLGGGDQLQIIFLQGEKKRDKKYPS